MSAAAAPQVAPAALARIASAALRAADGSEVRAASLFASGGGDAAAAAAAAPPPKAVLVYALRRPGCILCRDNAAKLWAARGGFEALGVRMVCVAHEWLPAEIAAFAPAYWGGPVYLDTDKAFFKLFSKDGERVRTQSALTLLNPFNAAWRRLSEARKAVADSNLVGDGTVLGGVALIQAAAGGGSGGNGSGGAAAPLRVLYAAPEASFGDLPPSEAVLEAVKAALG